VQAYYSVAIITLLTGLVCFGMALTVARAHAKTGILAPTMTGNAYLERCICAHANTLEWIPMFLPQRRGNSGGLLGSIHRLFTRSSRPRY
jgi:glutathione S-transferase